MNMGKLFALALGAAACLTEATQTPAQPVSWVGASVIGKKPPEEMQFGDLVNCKQVYFPFSGLWPITVTDDREGRLRIHDGRRDGWANKADFILARDAAAYFNGRVQANPKDFWALFMRAAGWHQKGQYDNAIKDLTEYIGVRSTDASAYNNRGLAWHYKKTYDKAITDFNEAIRLSPSFAPAYNNRGLVRHDMKEYDLAIRDFDEAMRIDPSYAPTFNSSAWLLATCPDAKFRNGKVAIERGKKACELTNWKDDEHIDTLAAACAEAGDFGHAISYEKQALEVPGLEQEKRDRYSRRLKLYEVKKAYRQ
jgi:tetratricopeptide (TPR) repeat protein